VGSSGLSASIRHVARPPRRDRETLEQSLLEPPPHTGILDERNEDLERIPGWLEHELAD
jgi:hypothetical protein